MKKFFLLITFFLALNAGAQSVSLLGKWKASQKGNMIFLLFNEDSSFLLKYQKDSIGGKRFMFGEGEATSTFKVDTSFKPLQIDFIIMETASGTVINRMKGIFEVIGPGKIRLRMSMDAGERPKTFLPRGNEETLVFVKQ